MNLNIPYSDDLHTEAKAKPDRLTAAEREAARRDRHGWRTAAKVNKLGQPTKAKEKALAKARENAIKAQTRSKVWLRSSVCQGCGDSEEQSAVKWWKREHEAHEIVMRSLTRNMPPEYRFSTENTARLCCRCHQQFHRHRLGFDFHSDLRMDGPFTVVVIP